MELKCSLPHLQEFATCPILRQINPAHAPFAIAKDVPKISLSPRNIHPFHNKDSLYGENLLAARPKPKIEDYHLPAVREFLFNIFAATLHVWWPFLHPQPVDAPCCGDRDPLITATLH